MKLNVEHDDRHGLGHRLLRRQGAADPQGRRARDAGRHDGRGARFRTRPKSRATVRACTSTAQLVGTVKRKKLTNDVAVARQRERSAPRSSRSSRTRRSSTSMRSRRSRSTSSPATTSSRTSRRRAPRTSRSTSRRTTAVRRSSTSRHGRADASTQPARISAVQIYVKTTPPVARRRPSRRSVGSHARAPMPDRGSDDEP